MRLFALLTAAALPALAADPSLVMTHTGRLLDATDAPVTARSLGVAFRIFEVSGPHVGEQALWESGECAVDVDQGWYAVELGESCGLSLVASLFPTGATRWLEVEVDGNVLSPRLRLGTVPTAAVATTSLDTQALAAALGGGTINAAANPVSWTALRGVPPGLADGDDAEGLTSVATAAEGGLTGDGTPAAPLALDLPPAGDEAGSAPRAARADHRHDSRYTLRDEPIAWTRLIDVPPAPEYGAASGGGLTLSNSLFSLENSGVTPGAYRAADVTVDAFGRVTAIASGGATELFLRGPGELAATGATLTRLVADEAGLVLGTGNGNDPALEVKGGETYTASGNVETYSSVIVRAGGTITAAPWNGTTGGTIRLRVTGSVTVEAGGIITARALGYRGGTSLSNRCSSGQAGESPSGVGARANCTRNGGGGGGGQWDNGNYGQAGAGGGYGTAGGDANLVYSGCAAQGGTAYGDADLTTLHLGSGGGSGGTDCDGSGRGGDGGRGGGAISIEAATVSVAGTIDARGGDGGSYFSGANNGGGGGGAGGSILLWAGKVTLASGSVVTALGGARGNGTDGMQAGLGGEGRVLVKGAEVATNGTVAGTAHKFDDAAGQPPGVAAVTGTWISPPVALPGSSKLVEVSVFANRSPETFLAADACVADTAAGSAEDACFVPVATSGAVDVPAGKAFARVRVQVAERGALGAFRLRGVKLVTRP